MLADRIGTATTGCGLNARICTKQCVIFRVNARSLAEKSWLLCAAVVAALAWNWSRSCKGTASEVCRWFVHIFSLVCWRSAIVFCTWVCADRCGTARQVSWKVLVLDVMCCDCIVFQCWYCYIKHCIVSCERKFRCGEELARLHHRPVCIDLGARCS